MATGQRSSDGSTVEEQQLYNNLCLLGLAGPGAKALAPGVEVSKYTFRKPSTKVLEAILYQLYAAVWSDAAAQKEFRNVYPVADASQAKEFSQRISDWLKQLKDSGHLEMNSISTASQLRTASGFRLVITLLDLSTYALYTQYQRQHPDAAASYTFKLTSTKDAKQVQLQAELAHVSRVVAAMAVKGQAHEFARISRAAADAQRQETAAAEQLREAYYSLKSRHAALCVELGEGQAELLRSIAPTDEAPSLPAMRPGPQSSAPGAGANGGDEGLLGEAILRSLTGGVAAGADGVGGIGPAALPALQLPGGVGGAAGCAPAPQRVLGLLELLQQQLGGVYEPLRQVVAGQESSAAAPPQAQTASGAGLGPGPTVARHPNAIDGAALLAAARGGPGRPSGTAGAADAGAGGERVDLVAMLHDWSRRLETCVVPMCGLAGQPLPPSHQPKQQRNVLPWMVPPAGTHAAPQPLGPGADSVHPLVAPPHVSSGHAALLATQVGAHRVSLEALRRMEQQLAEQLEAARQRARQLEPMALHPFVAQAAQQHADFSASARVSSDAAAGAIWLGPGSDPAVRSSGQGAGAEPAWVAPSEAATDALSVLPTPQERSKGEEAMAVEEQPQGLAGDWPAPATSQLDAPRLAAEAWRDRTGHDVETVTHSGSWAGQGNSGRDVQAGEGTIGGGPMGAPPGGLAACVEEQGQGGSTAGANLPRTASAGAELARLPAPAAGEAAEQASSKLAAAAPALAMDVLQIKARLAAKQQLQQPPHQPLQQPQQPVGGPALQAQHLPERGRPEAYHSDATLPRRPPERPEGAAAASAAVCQGPLADLSPLETPGHKSGPACSGPAAPPDCPATLATVDVQRIKARLALIGQRSGGLSEGGASAQEGRAASAASEASAAGAWVAGEGRATGAGSAGSEGQGGWVARAKGDGLMETPGVARGMPSALLVPPSAGPQPSREDQGGGQDRAGWEGEGRVGEGGGGELEGGVGAGGEGEGVFEGEGRGLQDAASFWAMEIDSPSEEDIGAVLMALGCSPRTRGGLGGAGRAGAGVRASRLGLVVGAGVGPGAAESQVGGTEKGDNGRGAAGASDAQQASDQGQKTGAAHVGQGHGPSHAPAAIDQGAGQQREDGAAVAGARADGKATLAPGQGVGAGFGTGFAEMSPSMSAEISARRLTFSAALPLPR